eukprot:167620_1
MSTSNTDVTNTKCTFPIKPTRAVPEEERDIIQDLQMDSFLYGYTKPTTAISSTEQQEDFTIRIKRQSNIFNPDLVHTEVVHPPTTDSPTPIANELSRAFAGSRWSDSTVDVYSEYLRQIDSDASLHNKSSNKPSIGPNKNSACTACHRCKKKCVRPSKDADCIACTRKSIKCVPREDGRRWNRIKKISQRN